MRLSGMVTAVTPLTLSPVPSLHWTYKHMFPWKMTASVPICSERTQHFPKSFGNRMSRPAASFPTMQCNGVGTPWVCLWKFAQFAPVLYWAFFSGRVLIGRKFAPLRWGWKHREDDMRDLDWRCWAHVFLSREVQVDCIGSQLWILCNWAHVT